MGKRNTVDASISIDGKMIRIESRVRDLELIEKAGEGFSITTEIDDGDSPYTVLAADHILFCDTDGGAITANLPAGIEGENYKLINVGTSGNDLTIDGSGAETVYGSATAVLADGEVIDIHYSATQGWW